MATAFLFTMPYHGHVNPCLSLIQELTKRGERIVFYGLEQFRHATEAAGAVFRSFEYEETEKCVSLTTMAEWQLRTIEQTLDRLIADARADRPAYLIVDYTCLWGRMLAQHLNLPAAVLHSTYPITDSRLRVAAICLRDLRRAPNVWLRLISFLGADRRISRRWRVPRVGLPSDLLRAEYGQLHIVQTSRELTPTKESLGDRYTFVGPCIRAPGLTPGQRLSPLGDAPLLYVSLGTFWHHPQEIYFACLEAFRDAPIQVLISGSARIAPEVLRALPANFQVCAHVDQIEVLQRAAAFITHGGMNSVCEALVAEVPMLVFPQGFDQFKQAHYVETSGTGFALKQSDLTPDRIRELVERLMHDTGIRARCQETSRRLREGGGAKRAADLMLSTFGAHLSTSASPDPSLDTGTDRLAQLIR